MPGTVCHHTVDSLGCCMQKLLQHAAGVDVQGEASGLLRFDTPESAQKALAQAEEGKMQVGGKSATVALLEGDPEEAVYREVTTWEPTLLHSCPANRLAVDLGSIAVVVRCR